MPNIISISKGRTCLVNAILFLAFFNQISMAQVKECTVSWIRGGQSQFYSYVNAGQTYTIERDPGTAVSFSVWPSSTAPSPRTYYLFDWTNSITVNSGPTTQGYWNFDNQVGPASTEVWLTVNVNSPKIIIKINNYVPPKPDLTVSSITVDGATILDEYQSGQKVRISCRVDNNGSGTAASNSLGIYLGNSSTDYSNRIGAKTVPQMSGQTSIFFDYDYTFTDADAGTKYLLFNADRNNVVAENDENNNTAYKGSFKVIIPAPSIPQNLTATPVSSSQIDLGWGDSNNETGYKIERKVGQSGAWSEIGTVAANVITYQDINLTPSTLYYYRVRAFNGTLYSNYSNETNAATSPTPLTYGTTIINHGYTINILNENESKEWMLTMAKAIINRTGKGNIYIYNAQSGDL